MKTISVMHYINRLKDTAHYHLNKHRKSIWTHLTPFYNKSTQKLGIEMKFLNLLKDTYETLTGNIKIGALN